MCERPYLKNPSPLIRSGQISLSLECGRLLRTAPVNVQLKIKDEWFLIGCIGGQVLTQKLAQLITSYYNNGKV